MKCIGGIGNAYGGLAVQEDNGKFYWMIGGYGGRMGGNSTEPLRRTDQI